MGFELIKLYTVDFGDFYVYPGTTTTILLLGGEEYGVDFAQLRVDLNENMTVLSFELVLIEEGYEYPFPYTWYEYPFYLNKVEFIGGHNYEDGVCSICGYEFEHIYENGVCSICGYEHLDHDYENGVCSICGYEHLDHNYVNGVCSDCGYEHINHYYENGVCNVCGYEHLDHNYVNGICSVCGYESLEIIETVWNEGAVITTGSSITLSKARLEYQLIKLYTVDFGEIFVHEGYNNINLLLEESGSFAQLIIDLSENGTVLTFGLVKIEEGIEYPFVYTWYEYSFNLNKVDLIG